MSLVFLAENAHGVLKQYLHDCGHTIIEISSTPAVSGAVSSHPDLYLCHVCDELIVAPEQLTANHALYESLMHSCDSVPDPIPVFYEGESILGPSYPFHAAYNGACFGRFFIHNLNYTDPVIRRKAEEHDLTMIHVRQGYAKCNTVIVDSQSIITSDHGIARAAMGHGIDVLLISSGHVELEGFPYGFLGGASGRVGNRLLFNGDLSRHPDCAAILAFIGLRGLETISFENCPLVDIGSIIEYPERIIYEDTCNHSNFSAT